MRDPLRRPTPANRLVLRRLRAFALLLAVAWIGAACNAVAPTASPSEAPASVEPSTTASASNASTAAPPAGQTDTDWGRIWDALPVSFPVYPGATPAEEAQTGPASATFAVPDADAKTVASWMQTELERAAFATEALNGPLEDGSYVLDSVGAASCRVEVAVAPLGGLTTITIRYGVACPSP